jgi:hypothetical protein
MASWVWVLIAAAVVVLLAVTVWQAVRRRRTTRLRQQFGPEYDRTLRGADSRRDAEAELQARGERRRQLELRPLGPMARDRYLQSWRTVQAQFVDDPQRAVVVADGLIESVMVERGYPVENFEERVADVSVDHPQVVESYREGHRLAQASANGSTEDLRRAMRHYRALFDELVEPSADEQTTRGRLDDEHVAALDDHRTGERTVR